jgi:ribosomal protein S18 acetylase RimI-like enzyme
VPPKGRLELVSPDRYDAVYQIVKECFVDDEPLGKSIGLQWTKDLEEVWKDTLSHNLSVILVNEDNGDIMGFRAIRVTSKGEHWDDNAFQDDNLKKLFSFFAYSSNSFNVFERFGLEEVFEFFGLGVAKKYRQRGIGAFMIEFAVKFVHNLGVNPCFIKSTATSNFSKKIFENAGFEFLAEFPYDTYRVNGEIVFNNTGEHKSMKMYKRSF